MLADVGYERTRLLVLDSEDLNVLQRGKRREGLLQYPFVFSRCHQLFLFVDLPHEMPHIQQAQTILQGRQKLLNALSSYEARQSWRAGTNHGSCGGPST